MATLHKHSERTVRTPCSKCRSTDLYWAHDPNGKPSIHKFGRKAGQLKTCNKCPGQPANWTLINRDGTRHDCQGDGTQDDVNGEADETPETTDNWSPQPTFTPTTFAPVAKQALSSDGTDDDVAAALQVLLNARKPATVDESQVRAIVEEMLAGRIFPLQVEVKRPDGTVSRVKGVTHSILPTVLKVLATGEHVFLPGPAGSGKSHMVEQIADALGVPFFGTSVGPTMLESKLLGYMDAKGEFVSTVFYDWCHKGGIFLLDEVDNGNPAVLNVMNSALANGWVTFPNGETVRLDETCQCAAAGNTYGTGPDRAYVGRQALDAAFLDRFTFIEVGYDEMMERQLCMATGLNEARVDNALTYVRAIRDKVTELKLPIVMGVRKSRRLCRLLNAGIDQHEAVAMAVRAGLSDADWRKITSDAPWRVI